MIQLIKDNGIRIEFSPLFAARRSAVFENAASIDTGVTEITSTLKKFCEEGKASLIVIYVNDEGKFEVVDMSLLAEASSSSQSNL